MKPVHAATAVTAIALFWAGMVFGVSFLATLAKFSAPSLTLPVALDVGRHTFSWLYRAEWALALLLAPALFAFGFSFLRAAAFGILVAIIAMQALWLLPALSARTDIIQSGGVPPPSMLHLISVTAEVSKLALLLLTGGLALRALIRAAK